MDKYNSFEVIKITIPVIASIEWKRMPDPIPNEVHIVTFLPCRKLCLVIKKKSGPGLITANI